MVMTKFFAAVSFVCFVLFHIVSRGLSETDFDLYASVATLSIIFLCTTMLLISIIEIASHIKEGNDA